MNTLKRLLMFLSITYGIEVTAGETNGRVAPLTPIIIPTVHQIIAMNTRESRVFPLRIGLNKEESPRTNLRNAIKTGLAVIEPVLPSYRQPTNSSGAEEVLALSRLLSRTSKEESFVFPLSKRISFGLGRTEPEIGGVRASFNWKFKR